MVLRVACPAKLNLFLAVGPKDRRNYHPLRTVFQAIDLCDILTVRSGIEGPSEVIFDDPTVPAENTVTKTFRLLREILPLPPLQIVIEKHIPAESGLGGGSSDAAGLIRAAQMFAKTAIPHGELKGIAEAVGMDVPFFLVGGRARAEGYGERLTSLPDLPVQWIVVARPNVGCSTPEAYRRLDETTYEWRDFPETDELYNDFERVAPCESLELIEILQLKGAVDAALSGSGSAVFGRFPNADLAETAALQISDNTRRQVWVTKTLTRSESLRIERA